MTEIKWYEPRMNLKQIHRAVRYQFGLRSRFIGSSVLLLCVTTGMGQADDAIRRGPRAIRAGAYGVGRIVHDMEVTDVNGGTVRLRPGRDSSILVVCLTGTGCPLCKRYTPTLAQCEAEYQNKGVDFLFVNPNRSEGIEQVRQAIGIHGLKSPYVRDSERVIVQSLGALTTTEAFVIDSAGTLRYRGAVDDQYGLGYSLAAPRRHLLKDALKAVLNGGKPEVEATWAPGCELSLAKQTNETQANTYHNRISRIVQNNCQRCHRNGGSAPFTLESLDAVNDYASMIADVVRRGTMPPWYADVGDDGPHALKWANDCSLSATDKADLLSWLESARPLGNPADAPLPVTFPEGWTIGQPDVIFQLPEPVPVQATGQMPYRNIVVKTGFDEAKWVQAVEIQPGVPGVVHHVLVFARTESGDPHEINRGFLAGYVPGNTYQVYPEGFAKLLPPRSELHFQMHYTPNGQSTQDQTKLGLIFAKKPPRYAVLGCGIGNHEISIPPGALNHPERASATFPVDVRLLTLNPHMHLRGKAFRYDLVYEDGSHERLLDVPRYDFNWQLEYRPAEPIFVPHGARVEITGWYDNSNANPANPDPTKTVKWGPQTDDEMLLGYVDYYIPAEDLERIDMASEKGDAP